MSQGPSVAGVYPVPEVADRYRGRVLEIEEVMRLLPHRPPFLLVDRVLEVDPGRRAVAVKGVTINEPFFQGHFPGHPVMPGVLILEALAQVAGIVVMTGFERGELVAYFTGVKEAKFREPVRPGQMLTLTAEALRINQRFGRLVAKMALEARVDEKVVAEAECSFILIDPSE